MFKEHNDSIIRPIKGKYGFFGLIIIHAILLSLIIIMPGCEPKKEQSSKTPSEMKENKKNGLEQYIDRNKKALEDAKALEDVLKKSKLDRLKQLEDQGVDMGSAK